jgi:hypothetical protein
MLSTLVVQFTRGLVRRTIALRELDFALCAHTEVWRLSVRPLHVRRALELGGGGHSRLRSSKGTHFGALLERFSEGEESEDSDGDDDDVPLVVHLRKGKAIARSEDEDNDVGEGDQELLQQVGPVERSAFVPARSCLDLRAHVCVRGRVPLDQQILIASPVQGGTRNKKKDCGSFFFILAFWTGLTKYVIRGITIYRNIITIYR